MSELEGFEPEVTEEQFLFANDFATWVTVPGTIVCGLVLIAYAFIACSKRAREHLDRVSFRLLTYSLFFNIVFGIDYALTPAAPGRGCLVGAFFNNVFLCLSTFFTTCIAINLQLVLVHRRNGKYWEKYYVLGTVLLTILLNIPTVAHSQFGWNDDTATCWYSNEDSRTRLSWIIGTSSFWIALAATIETFCSAVVLIWLYLHVKAIQNLESNKTVVMNRSSSPKDKEKESGVQTSVEVTSSVHDSEKNTPTASGGKDSRYFFLDPRFRNVIIRIALYPIISLIMNYSAVILDLYVSIKNVETQKDYRILVADLTFYGLRGFAYGILAATDPSFIKAVKTLFKQPSQADGEHPSAAPGTSMHFANNTKIGAKNADNSTNGTLFAGQSGDWERQTQTANEDEKRNVERQL